MFMMNMLDRGCCLFVSNLQWFRRICMGICLGDGGSEVRRAMVVFGQFGEEGG